MVRVGVIVVGGCLGCGGGVGGWDGGMEGLLRKPPGRDEGATIALISCEVEGCVRYYAQHAGSVAPAAQQGILNEVIVLKAIAVLRWTPGDVQSVLIMEHPV